VAGGSIFVSLVVLAGVLGINAFTIMLLIQAGDKYQQFELGCLLAMLPGRIGKWSQLISTTLVWATLWGVLVGYMLVIQAQIVPFIPSDSSAMLRDKKFWAAIGTCAVIPLCFLNTKYLSFTSGLSVLVNIYLFGTLIALFVDQSEKEEQHICYIGFGPGVVTFASLMQYGVIIQFCVLPMYKEMKDRRPAAFGKAVGIAFTFLFILFSLFAVIGYMAFGPTVKDDILDDYPSIKSGVPKTSLDIASSVAKLGIVCSVIGVYPLMMMPMISPVREFEIAYSSNFDEKPSTLQRLQSKFPKLLSTAATFFIALSSMACSFVVTGLGELNAVSGAAQASFFVGIFPSLIAFYLLNRDSLCWKICLAFLVAGCCALSVMGFIFVDNHASSLDGSACIWKGTVGTNETQSS